MVQREIKSNAPVFLNCEGDCSVIFPGSSPKIEAVHRATNG